MLIKINYFNGQKTWHDSCYSNTTMYYKTLKYSYNNTDNELVFKFELAGKSKENVKVYNQKNKINIKVDDKDTYQVDFDEYLYDTEDYNFDEIKATMNNGLLSVSLPKKKERYKQIEID